ncbi:MAG TPA: HAMP domain-containing sensor histidine kinase [Longimicrobiales bacterium]|nr:HAMP domain-containing sensor histidine kinase [Longimicrobiales bacterium]
MQEADLTRAATRLRLSVGLAYATLLLLLLWSRSLAPLALLAATAALGAAVWWALRADRRDLRRTPLAVGLALLALALLSATATTIRLEAAARNWERVTTARSEALTGRLANRVEGALARADAAARQAASARDAALFDTLAAIRDRTRVEAVVVVNASDEPVAWAGDHRGRLPPAVLALDSGTVYPGGPLFGYLYRVAESRGGRRAVSAVLLQSGPPLRRDTDALAERFRAVTGERPRFMAPGEPSGDWALRVGGREIVTARLAPLSQGEWRGRVARTGRRLVFFLGLVALSLLAVTWMRTLRDRTGPAGLAPIGALSLMLMAAPLGRTLGLERLFSPAVFVLPIPGDFVIEGVIVVLLPLAAVVSTLRRSAVSPKELWLRLAIGGALVGGGFAVLSGILSASAGAPLLTGGGYLWYVLQPTSVVLLTILAVLLMPRSAPDEDVRRPLLYGAAAIAASVVLALAVAASWQPPSPVPTPLLFAWSIPFVLGARAVAGYDGRADRLIRWLAAGWLASSAVIPHLWLTSQESRLRQAEAEVESFGVRGDPYLSYLLVRFTDALSGAAARGEQGVELLYDAWVSSGLAGEPYPLELSAWDSTTTRVAHLPLGVRVEPDGLAAAGLRSTVLSAVATGQPRNEPAEGGGVSRVLAVPLSGGRVVTVAVAPRVSLRPTSALAAFVEGEPRQDAVLELIPTPGAGTLKEGVVRWQRTEEGWRSETLLREGRDLYHGHLSIRMPPPGVRLARGMLLMAGNLLLLTLLWLLGRLARGDPPSPPGGWLGWLAGFRARLIASLFAFFLMPTAVFGWAAYEALSEEVTRAARQVAERAVVQASSVLPQLGLDEAARRIGEDLLYYEGGALRASSFPEAVELGLYTAWLPPGIFRRMRAGEALEATEMGELAGRSYLVAYRRLQSAREAVAVPVWLAARDVAVRQREFAHLALFGALVGAVLSLTLSIAVGRALARPIGELRRAASAVGRGHLRVRLPEQRPDEFGDLFTSFNRMTRRLRRARAQELRTARILAWGEMARQVAHEIKNPLTPIKLSVQHLRRAYQDRREDFEPILDRNVEQILVEIERLTEIARAFSRYGAPEEIAGATEGVDLATVARDVLTLYSAPDRNVSYRLRVECMDCRARVRGSELREVLVNLLENARAAVGESGRVEVVIREEDGDEERLSLEVRDDGEGIPPDQLPRIFDPHFSTRSSGTGLGLAIVRRLVESWGGEIRADSELDEGTAIRLLLEKEPAPAPRRETGAGKGGDRPSG